MKTEDIVKRLRSRATDEDTVERAAADRLEAILKAYADWDGHQGSAQYHCNKCAALRNAITGES